MKPLFNTISRQLFEMAASHLAIRTVLTLLVTTAMMVSLTVLPTQSREGQASPILYWGKNPDEAKMRQLKALGVKSLICLRTNPRHKDEEFAESIGLNWFHVKTGVMKKPSRVEMEKFMSIVGKPENQPVYIFCVGGRDRTSFYLELYRMAFEGWDIKQVRAELKCHELRRKWPVFWLYDDVLDDNSEWIKDYVALHHLKTIKTQAVSSRICPCSNIKVVDESGDRAHVTTASSPANGSDKHRIVSQ